MSFVFSHDCDVEDSFSACIIIYKSTEQNWKMEEENVTLHDQCFVYGGMLTEIVYLTTAQSCAISSTLNAIYNTPSYSFYMWSL